jgi:hypothetical protein
MQMAHFLQCLLPFTTAAPTRVFAAYSCYHLLYETHQVCQRRTVRIYAMAESMVGVP